MTQTKQQNPRRYPLPAALFAELLGVETDEADPPSGLVLVDAAFLRKHGQPIPVEEAEALPRTTHLLFLIDESGSMSTRAHDVCGGFESYLEHLRGDGNQYTISVITFATEVRVLCADLSLDQAPILAGDTYRPGGNTALYDAIGTALEQAREHYGSAGKPYGEEPVLCIIMTDGEENSSKTFSKQAIVEKIARREAAGNWTFVYLGENQDAWAIASDLGLHQGNVLGYGAGQVREAFRVLSTATSTSASSGASATPRFFSGNGTLTNL